MPVEEIDLVEEILGPVAAAQWTASQPDVSFSAEAADTPLALAGSGIERRRWVIGLALAFTLAASRVMMLMTP